MVSHDRYLIERVTDDVVALLGNGKITHLPGGIPEYLRRRAAVEVGSVSGGAASTSPPAAGPAIDAATSRALKKDLQRWEKKMEALLRKEKDLHAKLATVGADYEAAADFNAQLLVISRDKDEAETGSLAAAEALEQA